MNCDCTSEEEVKSPQLTKMMFSSSKESVSGEATQQCQAAIQMTKDTYPIRKEVPPFLSKTYRMIDTCNPDIACWAEDGDNFIVKNPDVFSSDVIPQYFRHNNFSSFVRQLNFYGFRKIKPDPINFRLFNDSLQCGYWRFHHEKFKRGRPDLLVEIRKANQHGSTAPEEVDSLKKEVETLKERVSTMSKEIGGLNSLVDSLTKELRESNKRPNGQQSVSGETVEALPAEKRRRIDRSNAESSSREHAQPSLFSSSFEDPFSTEEELLEEDSNFGVNDEAINPIPLKNIASSNIETVESQFDTGCNMRLERGHSAEVDGCMVSVDYSVEPKADLYKSDRELVNKLHNALSLLPTEMKEMLVERIASAVTNPETYQYPSNIQEKLSVTAKTA